MAEPGTAPTQQPTGVGPTEGAPPPPQPNPPPPQNNGQVPPNGPGRTQLMDVRDRLFHALFIKVALFYAMMVPKPFRRLIELVLFMKALLAFFSLVYIHYTFSMSPATCLQQVADHWPRHGVLHIEINRHLPSHQRFVAGLTAPKEDTIEFSLPENPMRFELLRTDSEKLPIHEILDEANYKNYRMYSVMQNLMSSFKDRYAEVVESGPADPSESQPGDERGETEASDKKGPVDETPVPIPPVLEKDEKLSLLQELTKSSSWLPTIDPDDEEEDQFIVEYSLEYGFLRLSNATRERMNIPVLYVYLNPDTDKCFGDNLSRFILEKFLGYDDLLMAALKTLAEKEDNKGYLRNLVTGEHFRFISSWWVPRGSFLAAFFIMLLFTVSISMLLRYSHHQIFIFIVDLLQMLEFNVSARFPAAPLLTVILALVGMEAIMSEFFNDTTTAFYVILIVWVADQFDAICCHTSISKRHWLRFFYLYQYSFYAYHFRFNGQYSGLALVTAWLFIQHSMVYFLHHYELPVIIRQAQLQQIIIRNRMMDDGGARAPGAAAAAGAGAGGNQGAGAQPQQQAPGEGGNIAAGNAYVRGRVSYPGGVRPVHLTMHRLTGFRLWPSPTAQQQQQLQRPNNNNNNNADAQNNNTANAAGVAGNNNEPPGNPGEAAGRPPTFALPAWNQADTIIGNIRNMAMMARRIVNGPTAATAENNNSGGGTGAAGNAPGGSAAGGETGGSGADGSQQQQQQQQHHHHHHHHHHVHRRLPTIMNLGHLQRISLGRITISPQFTGLVNNAQPGAGTPADGGATATAEEMAGAGASVQVAENNGCNESGAPATSESVPEMESNARRQESDPMDDALPSSVNGGGGGNECAPGDSIIGETSASDKLLSAGDSSDRLLSGGGRKFEGSVDKLNSAEMASKVVVGSSPGYNSAAAEEQSAPGAGGGSSDQKTRQRMLGSVGESSIVSDRSGMSPPGDDGQDAAKVAAGSRVVVDDKLVNLNVNYDNNQRMLSSSSVGDAVSATDSFLEQQRTNGDAN